MQREHVMTILARTGRELVEGLADILKQAESEGVTLNEVYFDDCLRLRLVRDTLTDGSTVLNLCP